MEVTHVTHNLRIAPRKLRLVVDKIRHLQASQALEVLPLVVNKGAALTYKSLASAMQVAQDRNLSKESLVIQRVWCDEGRVLKRAVSRSKGRTLPIMKRSSHLTIVLKGDEATRTRRTRTATKAVAESPIEQETAQE